MIEVTDEMVAEGVAAWMEVGGGSMREHMTAAYRAMRALEANPQWVNTQQGAQAANGIAPPAFCQGWQQAMPNMPNLELQNRQYTAPVQRAEDQATPPDLQAMVDANGGTWTQRKIQSRIDALIALVLELARRSFGYPPGDATLQRLIAELEPTP